MGGTGGSTGAGGRREDRDILLYFDPTLEWIDANGMANPISGCIYLNPSFRDSIDIAATIAHFRFPYLGHDYRREERFNDPRIQCGNLSPIIREQT